jgi:hypothetical protein
MFLEPLLLASNVVLAGLPESSQQVPQKQPAVTLSTGVSLPVPTEHSFREQQRSLPSWSPPTQAAGWKQVDITNTHWPSGWLRNDRGSTGASGPPE